MENYTICDYVDDCLIHIEEEVNNLYYCINSCISNCWTFEDKPTINIKSTNNIIFKPTPIKTQILLPPTPKKILSPPVIVNNIIKQIQSKDINNWTIV